MNDYFIITSISIRSSSRYVHIDIFRQTCLEIKIIVAFQDYYRDYVDYIYNSSRRYSTDLYRKMTECLHHYEDFLHKCSSEQIGKKFPLIRDTKIITTLTRLL